MRTRSRRKHHDSAVPDLTPMIDVTFQLLIFFILATRFRVEEDSHRVQLPKEDGLKHDRFVPKGQVTIYCDWNEAAQGNSFVVGMGSVRRKAVENSFATLQDLVTYPKDSPQEARSKKQRYSVVFEGLLRSIEDAIAGSDVPVERLEISFARSAVDGAASGTAPWLFVSLAVDAAAQLNQGLAGRGDDQLTVTFKFADALQRYDADR